MVFEVKDRDVFKKDRDVFSCLLQCIILLPIFFLELSRRHPLHLLE